jgi:hypothetical protein
MGKGTDDSSRILCLLRGDVKGYVAKSQIGVATDLMGLNGSFHDSFRFVMRGWT